MGWKKKVYLLFFPLAAVVSFTDAQLNSHEERLGRDILEKYDKEVRPFPSKGKKTEVWWGMNLIQIMKVNEKDEVLTTTLYLELLWEDSRLKWNRTEYGNIEMIRLPVTSIWVPNVMLENSVDGNMEVGALMVHAIIRHNGSVKWLPPSIHRTVCPMNVSLFPFDWQNCSIVYRSASFDQSQMVFKFHWNYGDKIAVDKNAFVPNGEWDLIQCPVVIYDQLRDNKFQKIYFHLILKRKAQFYVLNMLLPCVVLTVLSCFTFFLPVIAGEKVTLSISLLLGETIFAFLFAQKLPSTSSSIPFAASYLLFSIVLLTLCITCCVFVCNLHYRRASTHKLPKWLKFLFLERLGPMLGLKQPNQKWLHSLKIQRDKDSSPDETPLKARTAINQQSTKTATSLILFTHEAGRFGLRQNKDGEVRDPAELPAPIKSVPQHLKQSVNDTKFVTKHVRKEQIEEMILDDWGCVAMVVDRLLMWIYVLGFIFGTVGYYAKIQNYSYPAIDPYLL